MDNMYIMKTSSAKEKNKERLEVNDLLDTSDVSELKAFIREALMSDDDLRRRFLISFSDRINDVRVNDCIRLIRKVFERTYYRDYEEELAELDPVTDTLKETTRRNEPEYAFALATGLYTAVAGISTRMIHMIMMITAESCTI